MIPSSVTQTLISAGRHATGPPQRVSLDLDVAPVDVTPRQAIYLAFARDGTLHYIGKVDRAAGTVGARLREHLRTSKRKRSCWRTLWIVPLRNIGSDQLLALERGLIKRYEPPGNTQHVATRSPESPNIAKRRVTNLPRARRQRVG